MSIISPADLEKLNEIQRLIDEAYQDYFTRDTDGHHKPSEGHISVSFGNYFERSDDNPPSPEVEIYAYVLGPTRSHSFDSIEQALETVKAWHHNQMNTVYTDDDWFVKDPVPDPYIDIEDQREVDRKEFWKYLDEVYGIVDFGG